MRDTSFFSFTFRLYDVDRRNKRQRDFQSVAPQMEATG